jgi:hypothetical protein
MHKRICAFIAFALLFSRAASAMSSTNYGIEFDSINSGGDDISSSTNYRVQDTVGEQATGFSTSTNYQLQAGYRQNYELAHLTFDIGTQENDVQSAFTAFNSSTLSVTVADATPFDVRDVIGVVENRGLNEIIAVGRIVSIAGTIITVDQWDGDPAGISSVSSGGDDFVYRLNGDAATLGTLTASAGATSLTHTQISTTAVDGYTVYVYSDGELRSGSASINDVGDGAVTIGVEEYGGRVSGTSSTPFASSADFALTTSTVAIQESSGPAVFERVGLIYKASIDGSTPAGSYGQLVYYIATANF